MPEHHSQRGVPDLGTKTNREVSQVKASGIAGLVSTHCPSGYRLREVPVRRDNDPPKKHVLTRDQDFFPSCYSSHVTISALHLLVGSQSKRSKAAASNNHGSRSPGQGHLIPGLPASWALLPVPLSRGREREQGR